MARSTMVVHPTYLARIYQVPAMHQAVEPCALCLERAEQQAASKKKESE